jgi:hypothetical protein
MIVKILDSFRPTLCGFGSALCTGSSRSHCVPSNHKGISLQTLIICEIDVLQIDVPGCPEEVTPYLEVRYSFRGILYGPSAVICHNSVGKRYSGYRNNGPS